MNKITLSIYNIVALLGLVDAAYLTYTRFLNIAPPCSLSILSGCAAVARSSYSVVFGVPLSLFGMIFYAAALALGLFLLCKKNLLASKLLVVFSVLGAISSVYFLYLQAFVIQAFCIYCVFSAICSFVLFAISVYLFKAKDIG
jgi:uncharacterized membrane protein